MRPRTRFPSPCPGPFAPALLSVPCRTVLALPCRLTSHPVLPLAVSLAVASLSPAHVGSIRPRAPSSVSHRPCSPCPVRSPSHAPRRPVARIAPPHAPLIIPPPLSPSQLPYHTDHARITRITIPRPVQRAYEHAHAHEYEYRQLYGSHERVLWPSVVVADAAEDPSGRGHSPVLVRRPVLRYPALPCHASSTVPRRRRRDGWRGMGRS